MLLDRPLKLCKGAGNGVDTACLMTATNMLIGRGDQGDLAVCVCPVLRAFIITTNDCMPDDMRAELYGPLPWMLVGTKTADVSVMVRRAEILSEAAQELAKSAKYAAESAKSAEYAAESAKSAEYAAKYAEYAAKSAKYAEYAAKSAKYAAKSAAKSAKYAAEYAARQRHIWTRCRDALVAATSVGSKTPVEVAMTQEQLCDAIGVA